MSSDKVRLGVIGLGGRGRYFARAYANHPDAELVALADPNPEALDRCRPMFGDGIDYYTDLDEFRDLIEKECLDIVQPDVTLSGGILMGKKIAAIAEAHNLEFSPHTWTNGLGLVANLQLMASCPICPYCEFPYEEPGWIPDDRDFMMTETIKIDSEGYVQVPGGPGLGVELDIKAVEKAGVKL